MLKTVLITGAGSGIGAATALEFSRKGYFVALLGRNKDNLAEVGARCESGARVFGCDLSKEDEILKTSKKIIAESDMDNQVLVNNAGIFEMTSFEEGGLEPWRRQFETNFFGAVSLTHKIYPYFKKQKRGSIVNVSSGLGLKPSASTAAYSATKAAMNNWTQSLALEGGPHGIRVNCICPGLVDTPIHSFHNLPEKERFATKDKMKSLQPLGRVGEPEDIAKAIYFFGSEDSSWTTGAIVSVDGGINIT